MSTDLLSQHMPLGWFRLSRKHPHDMMPLCARLRLHLCQHIPLSVPQNQQGHAVVSVLHCSLVPPPMPLLWQLQMLGLFLFPYVRSIRPLFFPWVLASPAHPSSLCPLRLLRYPHTCAFPPGARHSPPLF